MDEFEEPLSDAQIAMIRRRHVLIMRVLVRCQLAMRRALDRSAIDAAGPFVPISTSTFS